MQTIYIQGAVFRLINAISLAIAAFALLLGILFRDPIVFMLLFVSLGFPLLSLMTLIDHIKYDDQSM